MLGWLILIVLTLVLIVLGTLYIFDGADSQNDENVIFGWAIIIFSILILPVCPIQSYYRDNIIIPEQYCTINNKIEKVQEIITNKELNLADVEMNKSLAELIKEKEDLLQTIRINNKSPFAFYKISLFN